MNTTHKIMLYIVLLFLIVVMQSTAEESTDNQLIKRTVAIMPVMNVSGEQDYDFLCSMIRDIISIDIDTREQFYIADFQTLDMEEDELQIVHEDDINKDRANGLLLTMGADVLLITRFTVNKELVSITVEAYDILTEVVVFIETRAYDIDQGLFSTIESLTEIIADKMVESFPLLQENRVREIVDSKVVIEEGNSNVIRKLLTQSNRYQRAVVTRNSRKRELAAPLGKYTIIVVSDTYDDYTVQTDNGIYRSVDGVKLLCFDREPGTVHDIQVNIRDQKPLSYSIRQQRLQDIQIIHLEKPYVAFVEPSISFSTLMYSTIDIKAGIRLPISIKRDNIIYGRFAFGPNINIIQTHDGGLLQEPSMKIKFGIGYDRVEYIKQFLAIHTGFEVSFEFHMSSFILESLNKDKLVNPSWTFLYPSLGFVFPFAVELFAQKKVSLMIGIEPTLRLVFNMFYRDGTWYDDNPSRLHIDNLEATRGFGYDSVLRQRSGLVTWELFFYDMPIILGTRIKL